MLQLIAIALLTANPQPPADLSGIYSVVGKDGDTSYIGSAHIVRRGDGYSVQISTTTIDDEGTVKAFSSLLAIGLRTGDTFSVAWKSAQSTGITVYRIGKDGTLTGVWVALPGPDTARVETLRRVAPLPKVAKGGGA